MRIFFVILSLFIFLTCCSPVLHKNRSYVEKAGYAIQVGAFSDVQNAINLVSKLQNKGIDAFYFKKPEGFFVVRFGSYKTKDLAEKDAKKYASSGLISDYFIAPPVSFKRLTITERKKYRENDIGIIIAKTAERFVGIPYKWGGNNVVEGMDCSGFVKAVYNLCGINLPRTANEQFLQGEYVRKDDLSEGDLVFFGSSNNHITHVGIYVGNGYMVHAPKRGDVIKRASIDSDYFSKRFVGAKRYY